MRRTDAILAVFLVAVLGFLAGLGAGALVRAHASDGQAYIILNDDHTWVYAGAVVPTPPDATPTASLTPPAPLTNTPRPEATPTREITPPATPAGTPTPKSCVLKMAGFSVNIRVTPDATSAKVGILVAGQTVRVDQFQALGAYLWAHLDDNEGWFASAALTPFAWWTVGVTGTELCDDVPGFPSDAPPITIVARVPAVGVWVGPGADLGELVQLGQTLKAAGLQPAATVYGYDYAATLLHDAGWTVAARPWLSDCAAWNNDPVASARGRVADALDALRGVRYTWLSLTNECWWPDADYAAAWISAAVEAAAGQGVTHLIPVVWNSGAPELDWMKTLAPVYLHAPIEVCFGVNVYPVDDLPLASHTGIAPWTTWRYAQLRAWLPGVPICVTEIAKSDGTKQPDFEDIRAWWDQTEGDFEFATFWYTAMPGGLGHWPQANLRGRLGEVAAALIASLD